MDTAYNTYGNNAMEMGLATAGPNNTVQTVTNQLANNVIAIADKIGINMVDRDVERSLGGDTRGGTTKKAKFTPSSKSKIELKYSDYVISSRQNKVKEMTDNVVNIDEYRKPIATENVPSLTCQRLSERVNPKTNQLEKTVTLHNNVIDMSKHIFTNSCKPIKVNNRSITNCLSNRASLEKYYGKPVESVHTDSNSAIDVSNFDNKEVTESVNDAFRMSSSPLSDTFQVPSVELNSNMEKTVNTITEPSSDDLSDMERKPIEPSDKKIDATSEYNVDALFKKDVDTTNFQFPSVDSLKTDSIDVVDDISNNDIPKKVETSATQERINDYIDTSNSRAGLMKLKEEITKETKEIANLQQVVGTYEPEIISAQKKKASLQDMFEETFKKAQERRESLVQTRETLDRTRQQMEEDLQKTQTDISNIMSDIEQLNAMLDVKVPTNPSANRGKRGKAA